MHVNGASAFLYKKLKKQNTKLCKNTITNNKEKEKYHKNRESAGVLLKEIQSGASIQVSGEMSLDE